MSMPKIECEHIDKCCAASSLIQSIALEETAISHILNAEGEKISECINVVLLLNRWQRMILSEIQSMLRTRKNRPEQPAVY